MERSRVEARNGPRSKRDSFERLAQKRTGEVIKRIRILAHCANPYAYEYDEADVRKIFKAIEDELKIAKSKFLQKRQSVDFKL